MSFPAYPMYKDSGVEWLGSVPQQWGALEAKRLFTNARDSAKPGAEQLAATQAYGVIPQKQFMERNDVKVVLALAGTDSFKDVRVDDFVISLRSFQGGIEHSAYSGCVSPAYTVLRRKAEEKIDPSFFKYLLKEQAYISALQSVTTGIREGRTITYDQFGSLPLPIVPFFEQTQIARFLNHETVRIDALIEEQQCLIELLKEKRQALISQAVTKGLDPTVPMKDSGLEWLGEVPAHWAVAPTSYHYEIQLGRMLNEQRAQGDYLKPYLRVFDVQWNSINTRDLPLMDFPPEAQRSYRLKSGDLLVNEGGSYVGRSAIWRDELDECYYQKALHRLRARDVKNDTAEFFLYVMEMATQRGVFVAGGNQTTIDHLTAEQLRQYRFAFPPLKEQQQIAEYISTGVSMISNTVCEAEMLIGFLQERRSALISAAVTGKIDVRGWQPAASVQAPELAQEAV